MSTLVLLKPDCVEHKLLGWCIACFEAFGVEKAEMRQMNRTLCLLHYLDHHHEEYYPRLRDFMCSSPLMALQIQGDWEASRNVAVRIRQQWSQYVKNPRNLIHASDSADAAKRELELWF